MNNNLAIITKSSEFAKQQQQAICKTAFSLYQKSKIKKTEKFSYAILQHDSLNSKFTCNYYSLDKIAGIILSIQEERLQAIKKKFHQNNEEEIENTFIEFENGQNKDLTKFGKSPSDKKKLKSIPDPFVLCVFDMSLKRYFVFGKEIVSVEKNKNRLGQIFQISAERAKVRFSLDSFENGIIEVHQDDFEKFLEELVKY